MKTWTIAKLSWGLALASLPLAGGCVQESNSAPAETATNQVNAPAPSPAVTNAPPPEIAGQELENAPGKIVSTAQPPAQAANLTAPAAEVAKLAQSGVDEDVMLAYITNSGSTFALDSDQIIYLNDIGVPGNVVTAMIQHDQALKLSSTQPPPVYSNPPATQPAEISEIETQAAPAVVETAPPTANVTYTYFYDSLAPYGNWIDIEGYGRCWQPTVAVGNRGWAPYGDRGRWVYTDYGWDWASDYSWGWAPFHYGRWFRHNFWGWCWAPDTVWGPAWVSWRYSPDYYGWAPLPPTAYFRPGFGFSYYGHSVGVSFGFGLGWNHFTFVPSGRFHDPHPIRHRVHGDHAAQIFNHTTVINPVVEGHGNSRFHKGIPREHVAQATHTDIKPVRVHETTDVSGSHRGERLDRHNGSLTVFRPRLPDPPANQTVTRVGEGVRPATRNDNVHRLGPDTIAHRNNPPAASGGGVNSAPGHRRDNNVIAPAISRQPAGTISGNTREATRPARPEPNSHSPNVRANENPSPHASGREVTARSPITRGRPDNANQPATGQTPAPVARPQARVQNNLILNRPQQTPAPSQPAATPAPAQNQNVRRDQYVVRQETPRFQQHEQRIISQPAPQPRQVEPRVYQAPAPTVTPRVYQAPAPVVTPRVPQSSFSPPPQHSAPVMRSQPAPVAPRIEAPQVQPRQVPPQSAQPSHNNNRQDGGGGRRNR